jgi:hypothetical protein
VRKHSTALVVLVSLLLCSVAGASQGTPLNTRFKSLVQDTNRILVVKCRDRFIPAHTTIWGWKKWNRGKVMRVWHHRHLNAHWASKQCRTISYWIRRQIWAGNVLGRESRRDPWPNCRDPWDGSGASWYQTVQCENGGNWYDSPGYYRCGLQFDPAWESRFGQLCPN